MKDTTTAVWFTFRDDESCLIESIRSVRACAPWMPLAVFEDAAARLSPDVTEALQAAGVRVDCTGTARHGNLRGEDWVRNQLQRMAEIGGSILKIDADTVLCGLDWLDLVPQAMAVGAVQMGDGKERPGAWFQGACYLLRPRAAEEALSHMRWQQSGGEKESWPESLKEWPEDLSVAELLMRRHGPLAVYCARGYPHGNQIAHYRHGIEPDLTRYLGFNVVSFGARDALPGPPRARRALAADTMRRFCDLSKMPHPFHGVSR